MVNQSNNRNFNQKRDKKEEWIYRIVRILIIFAIVWIIGTKFAEISDTETASTAPNVETDVEANIETSVETDFEAVDETEIIAQESETPELEADENDITDGDNIETDIILYTFRNQNLLDKHYEKHGIEMGFSSPEEYELAASAVVSNPNSLHKIEAEDGDDVYFLEDTEEFVVVSTDGYIRTYYFADIDYFNRQ